MANEITAEKGITDLVLSKLKNRMSDDLYYTCNICGQELDKRKKITVRLKEVLLQEIFKSDSVQHCICVECGDNKISE